MEQMLSQKISGSVNRWSFFDRAINGVMISLMETLDGLGYIATGFSFLMIGMVVFVHAWYAFSQAVFLMVVPASLALVHDLLLVIILLELFRTIINFLKTKIITLEPFLYICVIASTRRILTTGAQVASLEELSDHVFQRYLLDLGANVLVIVALVGAVYVVRRFPFSMVEKTSDKRPA
ncbi:MAG: phosphate-starvation-inducible PsiE family protein [Nitrospira sp.]|nr:phosphate-starvation-inducible PsiE family protein [Nitrospira sp.]